MRQAEKEDCSMKKKLLAMLVAMVMLLAMPAGAVTVTGSEVLAEDFLEFVLDINDEVEELKAKVADLRAELDDIESEYVEYWLDDIAELMDWVDELLYELEEKYFDEAFLELIDVMILALEYMLFALYELEAVGEAYLDGDYEEVFEAIAGFDFFNAVGETLWTIAIEGYVAFANQLVDLFFQMIEALDTLVEALEVSEDEDELFGIILDLQELYDVIALSYDVLDYLLEELGIVPEVLEEVHEILLEALNILADAISFLMDDAEYYFFEDADAFYNVLDEFIENVYYASELLNEALDVLAELFSVVIYLGYCPYCSTYTILTDENKEYGDFFCEECDEYTELAEENLVISQ